jgi:hypothetical protein
MSLAHYLFAFRHKTFGPAVQVDNQCSAFISHDRAAYDFPFSLDKFGINAISFVGPYLLDNHLLGGLGGDSAELLYIDLNIILIGSNLSSAAVDAYNYITIRLAKMLSRCLNHCFFQVNKYRFLIDVFVASNILNDS